MFLEPKGRNWGPIVNWDDLGKIYAALIVTWTFILLAGIIWLLFKRRAPCIKLRNLPLAIASTVFLHIYLVKICLAYTTNGHFTCSAEYWIMSIYLPGGIALFQAYLVGLRSVWKEQRRLVSERISEGHGEGDARRGLLGWWHGLSSSKRSYCFIALGMLVQLTLTAILYAVTPTLQGDWSSYGKISHAKGQALCRKSLAWIPSAFWQLFWTWVYGPYTLFRIRHIHDIHLWRVQVIVSVLSGLPGTPLWLAALYSPVFKPVNRRFVPPMWLAPGIVVIQFVTIFFPIYEDWQANHRMRRTLSLLNAWDNQRSEATTTSSQASLMQATPKASLDNSFNKPSETSPKPETRINTMDSLRKVMAVKPAPLLEFAATKDFSAENILFLIHVKRWRSAWLAAPRVGMELTGPALTHLFNSAVDIYATLINDRTAEFSINIESKIRGQLDALFESALSERGQSHVHQSSAPFGVQDSGQPYAHELSSMRMHSSDSEKTMWDKRPDGTVVTIEPVFGLHRRVEPVDGVKMMIPEGFSQHVFDEAERSIEYLVLTNTWQRFVKDKAVQQLEDVLECAPLR